MTGIGFSQFRSVVLMDDYRKYAGCIILEEKKTLAFKVDFTSDLVKAMQTMEVAMVLSLTPLAVTTEM